MPRKLKVYAIGRNVDGQWRVVAAVFSKKEFAELARVTLHYVNGYGMETGNRAEVSAAMAKPHKLLGRPNDKWLAPYKEVKWKG